MSISTWKSTTLADAKKFEYLNGLWKGKKPPFEKAVVIRNTNFRNDGILDLSDVAVLDVETRQLQSRRLCKGDIIIERSGGGPKQPVGRVCYFNVNDSRPHSFSNFTTTLRVKDREVFLPLFVHYNLLHLYQTGFTFPLQRATTGIRNLDFGAYQKAEVPIPPKPEQEKIAIVLWKIQRAIQVEEKLTTTARELKRSAMRRLFTCGVESSKQKDTEFGPVPKDWEAARLADLLNIKHGYAFKGAFFAQTGKYILLTPGHFFEEGGFRDQKSKTKYYNGLFPEEYLLQKGDLLVAMTEQTSGLLGSTITIPESDKYLHNQRLGLVTDLNEARLNKSFLFYFLARPEIRARIEQTATGSKVRHTSPGRIRDLPIALPNPDEQKEIATILQTIDRKISVHERKRAALADLFQTLLHQLMTAQIRVDKLDIDTSEVAA